MYSIEFTKNAEKQFYKLPEDIQIRMVRVLERIKIRPFHFVKRKEGTPYFIMRVGDYRAVLDIKTESSKIFVMETGHRKNIYD
jgi:mRNA interferase RelE/StbE